MGNSMTNYPGYKGLLTPNAEHFLDKLGDTPYAALLEKVPTLFDALAHGDEAHRAWLKTAITNHFAGVPVPPVSHGVDKATLVKALEEEVADLKHDLDICARDYCGEGHA